MLKLPKYRLSLILAASQNGVIGANNRLPWRLPADLAYFKRLTLGHSVVMGRKTYESIGRPLPGRANIIITRQANFQADGCHVVHSFDAALALCPPDDEVFIIGGADIYRQALPRADKIYLTRLHADFTGDLLMFELDPALWQETSRQDCVSDEKNAWPYSFLVFERKRLPPVKSFGNI
jgi:dihydrofolate reductase